MISAEAIIAVRSPEVIGTTRLNASRFQSRASRSIVKMSGFCMKTTDARHIVIAQEKNERVKNFL